jgi:hypothetical protein
LRQRRRWRGGRAIESEQLFADDVADLGRRIQREQTLETLARAGLLATAQRRKRAVEQRLGIVGLDQQRAVEQVPRSPANLLEILGEQGFGNTNDGIGVLAIGETVGALLGAHGKRELFERAVGAAEQHPAFQIVRLGRQALGEFRRHGRRRIRHVGHLDPGIVAEGCIQHTSA